MRPYLKNNYSKRAGDMVQVIECLPSKCNALSSTPVQERERDREREREQRRLIF
jgi:hypothetical protein